MVLLVNQSSNFTTEVLESISQFANGNIYVAFTVLITLLSAGLLYVAIRKEKIDRKFFPLLWFFLITNFIFSLKKEAELTQENYEDLRAVVDKLEIVVTTDEENVNILLEENKKLRESLEAFQKQLNNRKSKKENKTPPPPAPDKIQLKKADLSLKEIQQSIKAIDSLHQTVKLVPKNELKKKN